MRKDLDEEDTQLLLKYKNDLNGLVVGIPQEFYVDSLSSSVLDVWRNGIKHLESLGAKIVSVSIPHVSLALPAYYIIALAEASSNLSRYDGIRYGNCYMICKVIILKLSKLYFKVIEVLIILINYYMKIHVQLDSVMKLRDVSY